MHRLQLTSLERVKRSIQGKEVDCIPMLPEVIAAACQITGVKQSDYSKNPEIMANTLIKVRELCDFDGIYVSRDNLIYHQAMGGEVIFPDDDEPYNKSTVLNRIEDFTKLSVPSPKESPAMKTVLEAARLVTNKMGDSYYIQANIDSGPFEMAGILRGVQDFLLELTIGEEKLIHKFLSFCTEVVVEYGRAMIDTGVHGIQYGDSIASLVNPELYKKFVFPYQEISVNALSNNDCDIWIHICGKTDHIIPFLKYLNIQGYEVDSLVQLDCARLHIGDRIALKGNIDTTFLLTHTAAEVYSATQECIKSSDFKTGLIMSPGCGVPRMTPIENLQAMVQACRDYKIE
jgi:uroporphyrinogen decarboxylase